MKLSVKKASHIKLIYRATLLLLALSAIIGATFVDRWWIKEFKQQQYDEVEQQITRLRNRINLDLQYHFQAVIGLPSLFLLKPSLKQEEFASAVKHLVDSKPDIRSMAVAPGYVIQYMYPIKGNEAAMGFDYRTSKEQFAAVEKTIKSKKAVLAGPIELVQGGVAFILRLPVFMTNVDGEEQFWGIFSSVIDTEIFFQQNGLLDPSSTINVAIKDKDDVVFFGDEALFNGAKIYKTIDLPQGQWVITGEPLGGWNQMPASLKQQRGWIYLFAIMALLILVAPFRLLFKNQEANDKFRRLIEGSPTAQLLIDQNNQVIDSNQAFKDKFQYSLAEIQQLEQWQNISQKPEDIAAYLTEQNNQKRHDSTQRKALEIELQTKDNTKKDALLTVSQLSASPQREKLVSIIDISERKKVEQQLLESNVRLTESESLLSNIFLNFPDLVWLKNTEGVFLACNSQVEAFFGAKHTDILGKTDYDFVDKAQADLFRERDRVAMETNQPSVNEENITYKSDKHKMVLETTKIPLFDDNGHCIGTLGIGRDITERKRNEEALLIASKVFENSNEAMVVTDNQADILDVNPAFSKVTGYKKEEAVGQNMRILSSGKQDKAFYHAMWQQINEQGNWEGEIFNRKKSGEEYLQLLKINAVYDNEEEPTLLIGLFHDISEQYKAREEIRFQAHHDSLTKLPNRLYMINHLEQEIKRAKRHGFEIGVLFLDLDGFKDINDSFGHDMGDELLTLVAERLLSIVREEDVVARQGGDEFLVVMSNLPDENAAVRVAEQIIHEINQPFEINKEQVFITVSIGVSFYPYDGTTHADLMKTADQAMYFAKEKGKNRMSCYTQDMQENINYRMQLKSELHNAVNKKQFELHFQPVVSLTTGCIIKAEALIRWHHPIRGLVSPIEFIPIAEETKLINEIGHWVFLEVCAASKKLTSHFGPDFQLSFNLSPAQLGHEQHHPLSWLDILKEKEVNTSNVVVEITESVLMDKNEKTLETLLIFRDAGLEVAIDDFGTGYSSLAYINKYDIDYLKIDREFVRNIAQTNEGYSLCEAIIVMAHKLGIKVIAEGVETVEQKEALIRAGCDFVQGYLFSKPIPLASLIELPQQFD